MDDPNSDQVIEKCDVMVMTHCSPAGLSITKHFTTLVILFPTMYVTFPHEYQFSRRLRLRPGLFPCIFAFIGKGHAGTGSADASLIKSNLQIVLRNHNSSFIVPTNELVADIMADFTAEVNDTRNRHEHLWKSLYNLHKGSCDILSLEGVEVTYYTKQLK